MIIKDKPVLIVKKEYFKWRIVGAVLLLVFLLGGMGAGVILTQTNQELRGKANTPQVIPSPFVFTPPPTNLEAPYIRLVSRKNTYGFSEKVPVEVYLNTAGKPTMEASLVVTYDPEVLGITDQDIEVTQIFKSAEVEVTKEGEIMMTLFVTSSVGHAPVSTNTDTKIATFNFKSLTTEKADTEIDFIQNGKSGTTLVSFSQSREDTKNILQNTEGVKLTITP